jgi:cytochrome c oxidase assembly protein Cox11
MRDRGRRILTLGLLLAAIGGMVTLVSFSVPLYRLFCSVTGANGTTQRVAAATAPISARTVTVLFNTDVAPGLPWTFVPVQRSVTVHLGEPVPVYFEATNNSDHAIVGHATFNVTPDKSAIYFKKIQCFCFTEERLAAHDTVRMPVQFFVDPRLGDDASTRDVRIITLSYEFFRSRNPDKARDLDRFKTAGPPDAAHGAALYAADCSACHGLDQARVGPPLRGVVGRLAGSVRGYPYSRALASSHRTWTTATLAQWLQDPQAAIPGALMPMAVGNAQDRADIIAYLATTGKSK